MLEEKLLLARLQGLVERAAALAEDVRTREAGMLKAMDDALGQRFRREMAAIKGLIHVIKSAVESEERIPHQLRLETTGTP
ncbi:hypothetical protein T484DRAFT_1779108 [Baffinella frigidus]|nr:hypothetical protein T484DRAFT_1779108 [Cryptophyta sp. CCMP2293]